MRTRLNILIIIITTTFRALPSSASEPSDSNRYLNAVREFADNVLQYGRDTYGPKHTPLFVDGLMVRDPNNPNYGKDGVFKPVEWIAPNGDRWILSNLASQQNLFRTLDALTTITGDPKYKQAAMDAIRYAFDNLRSPNGLLYWGVLTAYDAQADSICGDKRHCLKSNYPYFELMWEVSPERTEQLVESFWAAHILNWFNLDMNRIGHMDTEMEANWAHLYSGGEVFFESKGISMISTGSDLICAAGLLAKLSGDKAPLTWAKRLASRYVETRQAGVGISGSGYTYRESEMMQGQFGDNFKDNRMFERMLVPPLGLSNPDRREELLGYLIVAPGIEYDPTIAPWVSFMLLGDTLDDEGYDFRKWAHEELSALGRVAYRKKDNVFIPMHIGGTSLEGFVCLKDGFSPKGTRFTTIPVIPMDFWAYALAYRMTSDPFMWDMVRNIASGLGFGDIGVTSEIAPQLKINSGCIQPFSALGFLELYKKTGDRAFLQIAQIIGDNLLLYRFNRGFFVPDGKHIYTKFDTIEPIILLNLYVVIQAKKTMPPIVWPSRSLFHVPYRHRKSEVDNSIIYTLTESIEPPRSIHEVAADGDAEELNLMITQGHNVNAREIDGNRPLHFASQYGHRDIIELLIKKGVDIDARNNGGCTALHYASEKGYVEIVRVLIINGANVNSRDNSGQTPIHYAARNGHKDIFEFLIKEGATIANLHIASYMGDLEKAEDFINKGVDINALDGHGYAPLHYAAKNNQKEAVELLISKGADRNIKNWSGKTPLDIAVDRGYKDIAELLMNNGAQASIHIASWVGDLAKVQALLKEGVDVNAKGLQGKTALHFAAGEGHKQIVEFLLENGARVNEGMNLNRTAAELAMARSHYDVVELLMSKGADVTPLHLAISMKDENKARSLIESGVDVNKSTPYGTTPLLMAVEADLKDIVRLLINNGADVNAKENWDWTPLHSAVEAGYNEIVELLIAAGADVNAKDGGGHTSLWRAERDGYTEILEILRKHVADMASGSEEQEHDAAKDNVPDKIFTGEADTTSRLGQCVVLGKDINGDGYGDVFLGAPYYKNIQGRVYVYYGSSNPTFDVPDVTLTGEHDNDYFGHDIVLADFNNDRHLDMAVTALGYNSLQGRVYVYYGGPGFDTTPDKIFDGEPETTGRFGRDIGAGDINNDGCAELVVCADYFNSKRGRAHLYYGAPGTDMDTICDLVFDGEKPDDRFGMPLALGQDIDGDGYGDLLIGSAFYPNGDSDGRAYLHWGTEGTGMDNISDLTFYNQSSGEQFATSIELFDIDNDGLADIIIGARRCDKGRGRVYLYWGSDRKSIDATPDTYFTGEAGAALGGNIIDCGYANDDVYGDILVGGYNYDKGRGRAYLFYGNTKSEIDMTCDQIFNGENYNDRFSSEVALGDVNGDDFADVLIGARTFKSNSFQGRAYLYYGNPLSNRLTSPSTGVKGRSE